MDIGSDYSKDCDSLCNSPQMGAPEAYIQFKLPG